MPVKIRVKGNSDTDEYKDGLVLKEIFEREFSKNKTDGEILIICNATLFGQETKDVDIIVVGSLDKYSCTIKSKAKTSKEELDFENRRVWVNDFCFVIETKRHRAEDIQLNGLQLLVKYNKKLSDVTTQSENQKYSLKNYFEDRLNFSPYICNFIWFRSISWESIRDLLGSNESVLTQHNYLPNTFSFRFLMQLACVQKAPYNATDNQGKPKPSSSFNCLYNQRFDFNEMDSIFDLFQRVKNGTGQLTRQKIEHITKKLLDEQHYAQGIGEMLTIISGKAGTGKTIKLLRIACDLATNHGNRCLILTYNHALVSDIKRILALAEIPDGVDSYTVHISTLHKFFYEILIGFGIAKNESNPEGEVKRIPDYITDYTNYLKELHDYIESGLIEEKEIQELMKSRHQQVGWDNILIDEAQDWSEIEKAIIFKIFGKNKVIIADGIDQLVRTQQKCNWSQGMKPQVDFRKTTERKGLRQKRNLVSFVNSYALNLGIRWEIEPKEELTGGKIIISVKGYDDELHNEELSHCKVNGNTEYEMMFLVPPKLVQREIKENKYGQKIRSRSFKLRSEFESRDIKIWDGTDSDLRTQYVVELDQHRLLQYESCRGLEGWTVICLELDEFIKYKMESYVEEETGELALESFDEKRDKFVYLWSLIPLTRAIDTLVITINDRNSKVAKALRQTYEQNPDFVQWIE